MFKGLTTVALLTRILAEIRGTKRAIGGLTTAVDRLTLLYAQDLQARKVPVAALIEPLMKSLVDLTHSAMSDRDLERDNLQLDLMRDEDFAYLEQLDAAEHTAGRPLSLDEREELLAALKADADAQEDARAIGRTPILQPRRASTRGTAVPFLP